MNKEHGFQILKCVAKKGKKNTKERKNPFAERYPCFRRFLVNLGQLFNYGGYIFMFFSILIFCFTLVAVYLKIFSVEDQTLIGPICSGFLTLILIPSCSYFYKNKQEKKDFQIKNYITFYNDLSTILANIYFDLLRKKEFSSEELTTFIDNNKSIFITACPDYLNDSISNLLKEINIEIENNPNISIYVFKCITIIRKLTRNEILSYVPKNILISKPIKQNKGKQK